MCCARFLDFKEISFAGREHFASARWRLWSWINVSQPAGTAIIVPSISNRFYRPIIDVHCNDGKKFFSGICSSRFRGIPKNKNPQLENLSCLFISFLFFCTGHITLPQSVSFSIIGRVIYFNLTPKTDEQEEFLIYPIVDCDCILFSRHLSFEFN